MAGNLKSVSFIVCFMNRPISRRDAPVFFYSFKMDNLLTSDIDLFCKVLDGVVESFIRLREIRDIPGTLNGLYLWLCQRLFANSQFSVVRPILSVMLAARQPLTKTELYRSASHSLSLSLSSHDHNLNLVICKVRRAAGHRLDSTVVKLGMLM